MTSENSRIRGTVHSYRGGYGFIRATDDSKCFVGSGALLASGIYNGLNPGDLVEYAIGTSPSSGKKQAVHVRVITKVDGPRL